MQQYLIKKTPSSYSLQSTTSATLKKIKRQPSLIDFELISKQRFISKKLSTLTNAPELEEPQLILLMLLSEESSILISAVGVLQGAKVLISNGFDNFNEVFQISIGQAVKWDVTIKLDPITQSNIFRLEQFPHRIQSSQDLSPDLVQFLRAILDISITEPQFNERCREFSEIAGVLKGLRPRNIDIEWNLKELIKIEGLKDQERQALPHSPHAQQYFVLHNNSFGSPHSTRGLSIQGARSMSCTARNQNPYLNFSPSDQPIPPMEHSKFQNNQRVALNPMYPIPRQFVRSLMNIL